jgi:putative redox protein
VEPLFTSDEVSLAGYLAWGRRAANAFVPGVVLCHGFPLGRGAARVSALSFPELADRIAAEMGWAALAFNLRGSGDSEGNFSLGAWRRDLSAAVAHLRSQPQIGGVWIIGFGTGGALAIAAAALDPEIRGVAAVSAPADFDDWASHPRRLLQHARDVGIIRDQAFPPSFDRWARELREVRAVDLIPQLADRPVLIMHGSEDDAVPVFDGRVLADAHGTAELRIIDGGEHQLRHDPRAVAVLLGWLDRQRNTAAATGTLTAPKLPGAVGG